MIHVQHCRDQSVHEPHHWTYRELLRERSPLHAGMLRRASVDLDEVHYCEGTRDAHDERCCARHGTHVTPHRGCALR